MADMGSHDVWLERRRERHVCKACGAECPSAFAAVECEEDDRLNGFDQ